MILFFSAKRDKKAAKRFFKKSLSSKKQRAITVDKNAAYPLAINDLQDDQLKQIKGV